MSNLSSTLPHSEFVPNEPLGQVNQSTVQSLFCKDHFSIYYIKSFNLVTVFEETKSVTKSRLHCTLKWQDVASIVSFLEIFGFSSKKSTHILKLRKNTSFKISYRTRTIITRSSLETALEYERAIITRGLYTFFPLFEVKIFFFEVFFS